MKLVLVAYFQYLLCKEITRIMFFFYPTHKTTFYSFTSLMWSCLSLSLSPSKSDWNKLFSVKSGFVGKESGWVAWGQQLKKYHLKVAKMWTRKISFFPSYFKCLESHYLYVDSLSHMITDDDGVNSCQEVVKW